ncbi:hypothetical protein [Burkholderia cenocepacia]|uniref:hypothetical protein n=1 Tax=Burkholderia cenocepacia TaxID=95486 RepID=UPI000981BF4C|nr:hypothetical protein [Burkholderia cenocepacia]AQQ35072.1 hypothetical protein A8E96_23220 [Burkholderia cenocepacia]ONW32331.1 hypothetical protein A8E95_16295 [Burkholderia cenocepacia]
MDNFILKFNHAQLSVINEMLVLAPYAKVAPVLSHIKQQMEAAFDENGGAHSPVSVTFTHAHLSVIDEALAMAPYAKVAPVITHINMQMQAYFDKNRDTKPPSGSGATSATRPPSKKAVAAKKTVASKKTIAKKR